MAFMASGGIRSGGSTGDTWEPWHRYGSGWPQLTIRAGPSRSGRPNRTAVTNSSLSGRRASAASMRPATAVSSGSERAASRNTPSTSAAASTAGSPLPRTSPRISRVPYGVGSTSYRSPPIRASASAAR